MNIFESHRLFRKIHYVPFWLLMFTISFIYSESVLCITREHKYFFSRTILLIMCLLIIPFTLIAFGRAYKRMLRHVSSFFETTTANKEDWINKQTTRVFSLDSLQAKIIFATFSLFAFIIIPFIFGKPYLISIIYALSFLPEVIIGGISVHVIISLLQFLYKITEYKVIPAFYKPSNMIVRPVSNYYNMGALITLLYWGLHFGAILMSPFAKAPPMVIWLIITSFFPLSLFLWSFFQIHFLMRRIKESNIDMVNLLIRKVMDSIKQFPSLDDANTLDKMMAIQKQIEATREWPFQIEGALTLIATLMVPAVQIILSLVKAQP